MWHHDNPSDSGAPTESEVRVLALAVYQIRILLSGCLGSQNSAAAEVRQAAHLAYALHNEAWALLEGQRFDVSQAIANVARVDEMLGSDLKPLFERVLAARGGVDPMRGGSHDDHG